MSADIIPAMYIGSSSMSQYLITLLSASVWTSMIDAYASLKFSSR